MNDLNALHSGKGGRLTFECRKCTRIMQYAAPTMEAAAERAKLAGWVKEGDSFTCPKCPAVRIPPLNLGRDSIADPKAGNCSLRELVEECPSLHSFVDPSWPIIEDDEITDEVEPTRAMLLA